MNCPARIALALAISLTANAGWTAKPAEAEEWPARPIRLVIPYAAGGAGDATFRQAAPIVEKRIGQPFVIENS